MAIKTYSETYLYNQFPYEPKLFKYLMTADHIDTVDPKFDDIKYEFKKRTPSNALYKVLTSKNVYLMRAKDNVMLNRQFRVFCAKDPKSKTQDLKTFIDCTGLIVDTPEGGIKCVNIDILLCHVVNAAICLTYHVKPNLILNNTIKTTAMSCFARMFTHIIDYLFKISTVPSSKNKCMFLACVYFTENILKESFNQNYAAIAKKIVDMSDREQEVCLIPMEQEDYLSIKTFLLKLSSVLHLPNLKVDNFIEKWMWLYGSNTPFALEYFPALSATITDAYYGAYLNNQKTIEKVVGNDLVLYTKTLVNLIPS